MTAIVVEGEEVMTEAEWEALVRVQELKTEVAWGRYLEEQPEFAARLDRCLNKIPAMVEEMEAKCE